jgi:Reverse transcriptase (RNA-dependent DNA polymerase)
VGVLFDIEKAYDTTWRYTILKQYHDWKFKGHLPYFICNFLKDRTFKVGANGSLSNSFILETGVPQGSLLLVSLIAISINSLVSSIPLQNYDLAICR